MSGSLSDQWLAPLKIRLRGKALLFMAKGEKTAA
jgi:hypothetical protein